MQRRKFLTHPTAASTVAITALSGSINSLKAEPTTERTEKPCLWVAASNSRNKQSPFMPVSVFGYDEPIHF